ncbi:RNA polymerase sigma factor [Streptomyces sp. NPDC006487]|uniref:RNA polymerase sigma factor n=1 Tax=Streptomyces sp. NPDC006487 TaxID=3364748 RepID=UPI0036A2E65D
MSRVHSAEEFGGADSGAGIPGTRGAPGTQGSPGDMTSAVLAAQQGDEAAFQALFRAVQPVLLRYLTVLVGEDAEDVASEAWLQISRDLGSFTGDFDGFRGWVSTIGRNRAMDLLRRRRRRPAVSVPVEYLHDRAATEDTEGAALTTMGTGAALALISLLPRDQAEAVLLRVVMDLDAAGAARVLGKRAGAVRMASHRGLRKLAKLLEQQATDAAEAAGSGGIPGEPGGPGRSEETSAPGVTPTTAPTLKGTT